MNFIIQIDTSKVVLANILDLTRIDQSLAYFAG